MQLIAYANYSTIHLSTEQAITLYKRNKKNMMLLNSKVNFQNKKLLSVQDLKLNGHTVA